VSLSQKIKQVREAIVSKIQEIKSDLGDPNFIDIPPDERGFAMLPVIFVSQSSATNRRLTTETSIWLVSFFIDYYYSDIAREDRREQAWGAGATIIEHLQTDPTLGGLTLGLDGDQFSIEDTTIDFGAPDRFLHGIRISATYILKPQEV